MSAAKKAKRAVRLAPGQEQSQIFRGHGQTVIQYEFGMPDGTLFTCQAKTLAQARARRDVLLALTPEPSAAGEKGE
jgi:hypothetical protein